MTIKGRRKRKSRTIDKKIFPSFSAPKKVLSPAGNRTPVFRVTGGDTHHYTTEDDEHLVPKLPINLQFEEKRLRKKAFPCGESNPGRGGESAES